MATFSVEATPTAGIPGEVHTTKKNTLLTEANFEVDGVRKRYIYLQGVASLAANEYVTYDSAGQSTRLVTTSTGPVAIASAAAGASEYFWAGIIGTFTGVSESSNLSNVRQYPLSAGRVDDAIVQNKGIIGLYATSAGAAGATHTVTLNRPWCGDDNNST